MSDNEQKDENRETVADIVAQIRAAAYIQNADTTESVLRLADRIDAAWKRERAKVEADALEVGGIVEAERHKPVGNAAAMREALVQCELFLGNVSRHGHPTLCLGDQCTACNGIDELRGMVVRALAAPARNCDINVNEGDTWDAYDGWAESYPNNGKTPRLLAPAEMVRKALLKCREIALQWQADEADGVAGTTDKPHARSASEAVIDMEFEINAALASPLRNCDVGTAEEQTHRMLLYCKYHGVDESRCFRCEGCPILTADICELSWAQMPYEAQEGGAK